jgi:ABC-type antimicrobial peptide transport system permease subunit
MEKENIITQYVSVWGWHLSAIIFLVSALMSVTLNLEFSGLVLFVAFMMGFVICELYALRRRAKVDINELMKEYEAEYV